ncbi:PaaI family thioesterase [Paenalcaligenes hominis]|uniref:PaaI family thioesterase n=1 Tax=Paenalcaligenes hominis TaxID=643674 RepID=UPI003524087A
MSLSHDNLLFNRVKTNFDRQGLMHHLGVELVEVKPGEVTLRMPFNQHLTQQHGYFHAGGTSAVADSAGGYAGYTLMPEGAGVLTVEFKINLMAPAQGEYLEAIGKVIRSGRTLTITQVDVFAIEQTKRTQVALVQQTLIALPDKDSH